MTSLASLFSADAKLILAAMSRSQAVIEFDLKGTILSANANFCTALGYSAEEIVGRHHSMFVDPAEAAGPEYRAFWDRLGRGEFDRRQYKRIAKGGREIWIEASYNPVSRGGVPFKVVKFATDITQSKKRANEDASKLAAIARSQAVIEFNPAGQILDANENFCSTVGYQLSEIVGKHHSMFCDPDYTRSDDYRRFWERLAGGEHIADEFRRIGKGGKEVWIQAAYNPMLDLDGKIYKIVKFATDVSERMGAIGMLGDTMRRLAAGDLTTSLDHEFCPTMENLRHDVNQAVDRLRKAMVSVGQNAGAIAASADEVRGAADDLARRTEQQAASVEQTTATVAEVTRAVSDASRSAEEAGALISRARNSAEHSGVVVRDAVAAMARIEHSSREISGIIGLIDEIAFQTNLLALNAGVEAARAGEAGRGFAVVAQEVRALAQRSAAAAKDIKALIHSSGVEVETGVSLVGETGTALEAILDQVKGIDTHVTAIVEGARDQAASLKEINQAVGTMDKATQQNAAMVEESTAASHSLASEAQALFALLGQFKLGDSGAKQNSRKAAAMLRPLSQAMRQPALSGDAPDDAWQEF